MLSRNVRRDLFAEFFSLMVGSCSSAKLWAPSVRARWLLCLWSISQGSSAPGRTKPRACSALQQEQSAISDLAQGENNHRGWEKYTKCEMKEIWGLHRRRRMEDCGEGRNKGKRLTSCKPSGNSATVLPPSHHRCLPLGALSQLGAFRQDYRTCPTFCFPTSFNKKTLLLHFPPFYSSPSN